MAYMSVLILFRSRTRSANGSSVTPVPKNSIFRNDKTKRSREVSTSLVIVCKLITAGNDG